jgi:Rrf2 family protein
VRLELTKRADYAIRAVLALGGAGPDERLSVRRIAAERGIPVRFLSQVMSDLVAAGLVEGTEGRTGGYRLAQPAAGISLLDVIEAIEGDSRRRVCILRGGPCRLEGVCDVHAVFAAAQEQTLRTLSSATIAGIAAEHGAIHGAAGAAGVAGSDGAARPGTGRSTGMGRVDRPCRTRQTGR